MSSRIKTGSVVRDKRDKVWRFYWWENGKRRSKALGRFPTKAAAWKAAKPLRDELEAPKPISKAAPTVAPLIEQYKAEKMPKRIDTRRTYGAWISNHIIPKWGECLLTDVQARPVELWLDSLTLAPKSKTHIRGLLRSVWDYAMWRGDVPVQRNPMELVTIKGATKRTRKPRSLSAEEFQSFVAKLEEPFRTIAIVSVCLGLRISECLGLKWSDVNWLDGTITVERGIVNQNVDDVKSAESRKQLSLDGGLLEVLKAWRSVSQFTAPGDWMFASPAQLGRLPWSYDGVWYWYQQAAKAAGLGGIGTHSLRHTFRTWLDSVGTPVGVQQRLMRHADIRTTMNIYGDVATPDMREAHGKIAGLALNGTGMARKAV